MSEAPDKESRTHEASEKKIKDAREKGNLPHSRELSGFVSLLGLIGVVWFVFGYDHSRLVGALVRTLDGAGTSRIQNGADAVAVVWQPALAALFVLAPAVFLLAAAGFLASSLQNAPSIVLERIRPQLSRVSPSSGFNRIFGGRGLVEFLKSLAKLAAVVVVAALVLRSAQGQLFGAMLLQPAAMPELIHQLIWSASVMLAVALAAIAAGDLAWSKFSWLRDLRMTHQEVKDEAKQAEGDPAVKARMKSLARDRSRRRMLAAVPKATVVIANPTHFAVALRYIRDETPAPMVVAKGQDLIALRIRAIAEESGVPVIEDKMLARALYAAVEVDRMIPAEFYKAVAGIVHAISRRPASRRPIN